MTLLSIVIPTYNERLNINPLIHRVTTTLKKFGDDFEIIIVDDDSPDRTWQECEDLAKKNSQLRVVTRQGEKGLASAVVTGWEAVKGEFLGVMEGDLQHPPETLLSLMDTFHADIVIASHYIEGGKISNGTLLEESYLGEHLL